MPTTYTWTVIALTGYPQYEGETDVVTTAFYTVAADDGTGHLAILKNIQQTPLDPLVPFIPYTDLTNEIVIGWVQSDLGESGIASIYACLDAQIENQINPPLTPQSFPLPWAPAVPPAPDLSVPAN